MVQSTLETLTHISRRKHISSWIKSIFKFHLRRSLLHMVVWVSLFLSNVGYHEHGADEKKRQLTHSSREKRAKESQITTQLMLGMGRDREREKQRERHLNEKLNQPAQSWSICVWICDRFFVFSVSKAKFIKTFLAERGENCNIKILPTRDRRNIKKNLHNTDCKQSSRLPIPNRSELRIRSSLRWHWDAIKLNASIDFSLRQWGSFLFRKGIKVDDDDVSIGSEGIHAFICP